MNKSCHSDPTAPKLCVPSAEGIRSDATSAVKVTVSLAALPKVTFPFADKVPVSVVLPPTLRFALAVTFPVTVAVPPTVVLPVTPKVPPTVPFPVTLKFPPTSVLPVEDIVSELISSIYPIPSA